MWFGSITSRDAEWQCRLVKPSLKKQIKCLEKRYPLKECNQDGAWKTAMPPGFKSVVNRRTASFVSAHFMSKSSPYIVKELARSLFSAYLCGEELKASAILVESQIKILF